MVNPLVLLVCGLLPGALAQCTPQRAGPLLQRAVYEFAVRLTTRIAQENENHFAASPLSAWSLLATASLGAAGGTFDEFRRVLRLHSHRCFNDRYFELVRSAPATGDVVLERGSAIFAAEDLSVRDEFRRRVRAAGAGDLVVLPFDDPDAVAAAVAEYVSRATHDTIVDLATPADLEGVSLVAVDALYFKAPWQTPFPPERTRVRPFHDDAGSRVGEVSMMRVVGNFRMNWVELLDATVLELPFGAAGRFAMLVLLPRRGVSLTAVVDSLARVSLTTIEVLLAQADVQTVAVEIPKFDVASDLDNLKELLSDMGLVSAFDSDTAEFPVISEMPLYVSSVVQKARVSVSEEGAEASAATAGFFTSRSGPESFRADKPFFYMIMDTATRIPLITGAYSKPSIL